MCPPNGWFEFAAHDFQMRYPYRFTMSLTTSPTHRALGTQSLPVAADLLARHLGITASEANARLRAVADNIGISGTELAELVLYRDILADGKHTRR